MKILKAAYSQIKTKFQSAIPTLETCSFLGVNFYDDKYRVIRTYSENYLGGDDLLLTKYDFTGHPLKTKQIHYKDADATVPTVINQRFTYDHSFRVLEVYHQVDDNPEILMASYEYNELGQTIKKKLNQNTDGSFLQEIDYEYNIRGWLTSINNPDNLQETGQPKDMFAMEFLYNNILPTVNNANDEQYNGNIAAIKWNTPEFGVKAYGYGYDNTNRLERAKFAAGAALNADVDKYSVENITYDANGNILTLGRHNTAAGYIDNLTMTYDGNQLKKTHDSGDLVLGFVDMVDNETEYHYDHNGSMDIDDNKGFVFAYNYMNLPKEIVGGNDTVRYIYDASGTKISKELAQGGVISYTDYIGNFVYKDGDLDYISTDEGRITQPTAGTFQYEYFLTDHLGNVRTVFADGNGDGILADSEVLQETHYYPYGMSIGDLAIDRGADNKMKFGGKELQDDDLNGVKLDLFDFHARFYMADLGRTTTQDPLAEINHDRSPYHFFSNNPLNRIDPDGRDDYSINKKTGEFNLVRETEDETDKVLKTNRKGEVKTNRKGKEKVAIKEVEKGILSDGVNFKENDNLIKVGGEGQATEKGVEAFALNLANYVGKEIGGAHFSQDDSGNTTHMTMGSYANNSLTETKGQGHSLYYRTMGKYDKTSLKSFFHTHPSNGISVSDRTSASQADKTARDNALKINPVMRFFILTNPINYGNDFPLKKDYTND